MRRAVPALLLALAMFNIAHADLLRHCQCGPDNPYSCGLCPASRSARGDPAAPC